MGAVEPLDSAPYHNVRDELRSQLAEGKTALEEEGQNKRRSTGFAPATFPLPETSQGPSSSVKGVWTTMCEEELMRKCHTDGNKDVEFPPETMLRRLQQFVQKSPRSVVFRHLTTFGGQVSEMTFENLGEAVRKCAHALIHAGVCQYDRVCIASAGSPNWAVAYLGAMSAGAIPCTLYENSPMSSLVAETRRCGARVFMTAESEIAGAIVSNLNDLPDLAYVILWEEDERGAGRLPTPEASRDVGAGSAWQGAFRLRDLTDNDAGPDVRREHGQRASLIRPGNCAAIVLTPGTVGQPKAVMLSHDNWSWTAQAVVTQIGLRTSDNLLACLPIASATAQLLFVHVALVVGCTVTYPHILEGRQSWEQLYSPSCNNTDPKHAQEDIVDLLKEIRPTVVVAGGWMWDLIASALSAEIELAQGTTAKKYAWALQQGKEAGKRLQGLGDSTADVGSKGMSWGVAKRVMFMKIWTNVGLDKCRYASSVGAGCNTDAFQLLLSVGIPVMCMYGSAEGSGIIAMSSSSKGQNKLPGFRLGYSGRALNGTALTVRRRPAAESSRWLRIHVKGRNVMMGYFNDAARTAKAVDKDGTLFTGDCGEVDWRTRLLIVEGREDDIMCLSTRKEVTSGRVEEVMRKELPLLSNVVAVGNGLPFIACLLTFETETSTALPTPTFSSSGRRAKQVPLTPAVVRALDEMGIVATTIEEARQSKNLTQAIIHGVQRANQSLGADHPPVKRFFILSEDLRLANNDLTPTLQLRRSVIVDKFEDLIEDIYDDCLPGDRKKDRQKKISDSSPPPSNSLNSEGTNGVEIVASMKLASLDVRGGAMQSNPLAAMSEPERPRGEDSDAVLQGMLHSFTPATNYAEFQEPSRLDAALPSMAQQDGQMYLQGRGLASFSPNNSKEKDMSPSLPANDEREQQTQWHMQMEEAVLETNGAISNVMVVGENRPFLSCLISLKTASEGNDWLHEDAIAAASFFDSAAQTVKQAKDDARFRAFLVDSIARVNRQVGHPDLSIRKFIILLVDFLPAVVKTKGPPLLSTPMRDSIKRRFENVIDSIYEGVTASKSLHGTPGAQFGGVVGTSLNQTMSPTGSFDPGVHPANSDRLQNGTNAQDLFENAGAGGIYDNAKSVESALKLNKQPLFSQDDLSWYPSEFDRNQPHKDQGQAEQQNIDFNVEPGTDRNSLVPQRIQSRTPLKPHHDRGRIANDTMGNTYASNNSIGNVTVSNNLRSPHAKGAASRATKGEELVQLVLDLDMAQVLPRMQEFCSGLHSDVCRALDAHPDRVVIRSVAAGITANIALLDKDSDDPSALAMVCMLQEQAANNRSILRSGAYTRSLICVTHMPPNSNSEPAVPPSQGFENSLVASMNCGVGLVLQADDQQHVFISHILPGSPAALTQELCEDDIVVEIDGQAMLGVAGDVVVSALKGEKGSLVRIAVMRGDISRTVYMVRGNARDSFTPAMRTRGPTHKDENETAEPKQSSPPVRRTRTSNVGVNKVLSSRMSIGTTGSAIATPSSTLVGESQRTLQVINMAFESVEINVWRRDGDILLKQLISPNGAFPNEFNGCGDQWPIPPGRDLCFTVVLDRETMSRKSFCLPEFDKRSVRVRIEVDSENSLLSVAPVLRKGKPIPGNIDAYSLRLNALPDTTAPAM